MDKKLIINFLKKYGLIAIGYLKEKFGNKILEALKSAWSHFLEFLWNSIKEDVKAQVEETCEFVNQFLDSPDAKEKENVILENLMKNIHLPVVLRPFKPLLKRILRSKLENLVRKTLRKLQNSVNI